MKNCRKPVFVVVAGGGGGFFVCFLVSFFSHREKAGSIVKMAKKRGFFRDEPSFHNGKKVEGILCEENERTQASRH